METSPALICHTRTNQISSKWDATKEMLKQSVWCTALCLFPSWQRIKICASACTATTSHLRRLQRIRAAAHDENAKQPLIRTTANLTTICGQRVISYLPTPSIAFQFPYTLARPGAGLLTSIAPSCGIPGVTRQKNVLNHKCFRYP